MPRRDVRFLLLIVAFALVAILVGHQSVTDALPPFAVFLVLYALLLLRSRRK